ncbi:MAG: QsdR family transcriptional regulator [Propionibacteriales bacterium]|nr:QsdR family transcriptional regulator [Propionibacteriales bacterium]
MTTATTPPHLERATRDHALRYARGQFERGERVDMGTVADALAVGRTTLYRWVGDREQLIAEIFAEITDELFDLVATQAQGAGIDRALDTVRRFMEITSGFPPLQDFCQREPTLALRILLAPGGLVQDRLRARISQALERERPGAAAPLPSDVVDVLIQVGAALQWTPIVIGEQPEIDRALQLGRTVLGPHFPPL